MQWLGLDIGGANIKLADGAGLAVSRAFPLWKEPERLAPVLAQLLRDTDPSRPIAATMTGELADCFRTKREGVEHIVTALQQAAQGRTLRFYLVGGDLVSAEAALERPLQAAASNWHALACYAAYLAPPGSGLLIDIGSTTTDLIPVQDGRPRAQGRMDPQRLIHGELVYSGVQRTPICAVVRHLPWRGASCPVAAEWFATTLDAYLLLGEVPSDARNLDTADGRPATIEAARNRLARCICADREMFSRDDARQAARAVQEAQIGQIQAAAQQVITAAGTDPAWVVVSGQGEFLARRLVGGIAPGAEIISLGALVGPAASTAGAALAVAVLAQQQHQQHHH